MKIVVVDTPREFEGEIDWSELLKLGETRIYHQRGLSCHS